MLLVKSVLLHESQTFFFDKPGLTWSLTVKMHQLNTYMEISSNSKRSCYFCLFKFY